MIVKSLQAAVLGKADRDIPPYWRCRFTTQQFWEMAAVCTVAAIYMTLIQHAYRFHHQLWWLVFLPPRAALFQLILSCLCQFFPVLLHSFYVSWMKAYADRYRENNKNKKGVIKIKAVKEGGRQWCSGMKKGGQSGLEALETWVIACSLPGGLLVQSINGNRKTAASLAHPGLGYALLETDGLWQQLLSLALASFSQSFFSWPGKSNGKVNVNEYVQSKLVSVRRVILGCGNA